ncbi:hypothetical protein ACIRBX_16085 [Kitasatospora sp. NPDC096147]|uniref:hypothetical protein n=1 Tax=Kitasatospora sp. NPDC096147 TaxID=3364093 RepID=UPI003824BAF7
MPQLLKAPWAALLAGEEPATDPEFWLARMSVPLLLALLGAIGRWVGGRRVRAADRELPERLARWRQTRRAWEAAAFCRRCRVGFLPAGSLAPDFPASAAIPLRGFRERLAGLADGFYGVSDLRGQPA